MKDIKQVDEKYRTPVLCIFEGQVPSKTVYDVILYNFLPTSIIGFIHTEEINPESGLQGEVDLGDIEARVAGMIDPDPIPAGMRKAMDAVKHSRLSDFVDNMINECDDCPDASPDNCNGCICSTPVSALADYAEGDDCQDDDHCTCGCNDDIDNDGMPPCLPNAGDDNAFVRMAADIQRLDTERDHVEAGWYEFAERCTFQFAEEGDLVCHLSHGNLCNFESCRRIGNE